MLSAITIKCNGLVGNAQEIDLGTSFILYQQKAAAFIHTR